MVMPKAMVVDSKNRLTNHKCIRYNLLACNQTCPLQKYSDLLTLLFVWQQVALTQLCSVVGQSSAQPSGEPFTVKHVEIPSG